MRTKKIITGVFLLIVGIGLIVVGFTPQSSDRQAAVESWKSVKDSGTEATGEAVSSQSTTITEGTRRNRQINTVYCPVYEFTVNNAQYSATAVGDDCKDDRSDVEIGSTATLVYNSSNPEDAFVKSDASDAYYQDTSGGVWVVWVLGIFLAGMGGLVLYSARPKTPEQLAKEEEARRKTQEEFQKLMNQANTKK